VIEAAGTAPALRAALQSSPEDRHGVGGGRHFRRDHFDNLTMFERS
jgi:hypothetical protein